MTRPETDWFGMVIAVCLGVVFLLWLTDGLARIDCARGTIAACERIDAQYKPAAPARSVP
jgi:hypothetical protein